MAIPNQAADSSEIGFLQGSPQGELPQQIPPAQPLEDYLQQLIAGVAGLEETLVRPGWQAEPPNLPPWGTNWAAFTINRHRPLGYSAIIHHSEGDGWDETQRHEELDLLVRFYGPECQAYQENLHDGLQVWQNRVELRRVGMAFVGAGDATWVPEFFKERWWERIDQPLTIRRIIRRHYPILNLLEAPFCVGTDGPGGYRVCLTAK